jgi:hypothetical protein
MLQSLKFKYMQNDPNRPVYLLTAPSTTFGSTRFFTRPYKSAVRDHDTFNVLVGYSRKHDCDLAQIAAAARGEVAAASARYDLDAAKHVAACLSMPIVVLIDEMVVDTSSPSTAPQTSAFFYDPKRKPSDFTTELRSLLG